MLATIYLIVTCLAGFVLVTRAVPSAPAIVRIPFGGLLAIVFTSWTSYLVAWAFSGTTDDSLTLGVGVSTALGAFVLARFHRQLKWRAFCLPPVDVVVTIVSVLLAWWLVHAHMHVVDGDLNVSANTWGDMGLHVSLSRSFAVGANYPTQYPFFTGEPIRYHFGFDFFAGMLQKGGFSVQWAFNLPATLGYTAMMLFTFATARLLFGKVRVAGEKRGWWLKDRGVWAGFIAVALLMTNQSLGWQRYLVADGKGNLLTALKPSVWWHHKDYLTGGPYTDDRITMFNTPNAYLTQSHLIVAMAVILGLAYIVLWQLRENDQLSRKLLVGAGITFGTAFWLNGVVWLAAGVFFGALLVFWGIGSVLRARREAEQPERRAAGRRAAGTWIKIVACFAVPALLLGVPQAILLNGGSTGGGLRFHVGYLVCGNVHANCAVNHFNALDLHDWWSFIVFWWLNDGLFIPLLLLAFFIGSNRDKKILGAVACIFLWGNLFQVGLDVGGQNHKVFNLWENLSGLFVAYAIVVIWTGIKRLRAGGTAPTRIVRGGARVATVFVVIFLTITGLIDFMTVKNDFMVSVFGDETQKQAEAWIVDHTPPKAEFLTDYDQLYTAPTLAGRGVALGFSSWASSAGYDVEPRKQWIAAIYQSPDQATACTQLKAHGMDYVLVGPQERTSPRFKVNEAAFATMTPDTTIGDGDGAYKIYAVARNCA